MIDYIIDFSCQRPQMVIRGLRENIKFCERVFKSLRAAMPPQGVLLARGIRFVSRQCVWSFFVSLRHDRNNIRRGMGFCPQGYTPMNI